MAVAAALLAASGCAAPSAASGGGATVTPAYLGGPLSPAIEAAMGWMHSYDWDGDGDNDEIDDTFSGGAHCCYRLSVSLSSTGKTIHLPFEVDGGYVMGLDLSQPEHLAILSGEGAPPELYLEIETYSYWAYPIPAAWTRKYGIHTNWIAVSFAGGKVRARDVTRSPHAAEMHRP